ncbi:hypothetical protein NMU03_02095 [Allocoprobacillus halotolerans]|uniref:Protein-glutamine gamma-glutamyltransferase TgpA N-terminal domain-containing protein n=1 Tax=Allocoprobacillus halotolerans TaxID=2944914 RepID=A0ABY5I2P5_9FIRM|nr:hypothetical protein [Allocoprobacillus halotolerans]UTY39642.1 hypothetical protein NMU03_02095 [Allocoprobacillus halotolerans]
MGIGIIALGLWLLLGISLTRNDIELFPMALSVMVIIVGMMIVLRKVKSRELLVSLGLWLIILIMDIFQLFIFLIDYVFFIALVFTFIGIERIAINYPAIQKYHKNYRIYLIIFAMIIFLSRLMVITQAEFLLILMIILFILLEIYLIIVLYHMIRINQYLEEDYLEVHVQSFSYSFHQKTILILLSVVSLVGIIFIQDGFTETIQQEVILEETHFLKVNEQDYKVLPLGYHKETKSSLPSKDETTAYSPIEIYMKQNLYEDLDQVQYQIVNGDQKILSFKGKFIENEYEDNETTPFDGYIGGYVEGTSYEDLYNVQDYNQTLDFVLKLYNDKGACYYQDQTRLETVVSHTYRYEDEKICIENFQYDMHVITRAPQIEVKQSYDQVANILIYIIDDNQKENIVLSYDKYEGQDEYNCWVVKRSIYQPLQRLSKIKIELRDENYEVIDSFICELEEVL